MAKKVGIIILHKGETYDFRECWESLEKIDYEDWVPYLYDWSVKENRGFAGNNNLMIAQALRDGCDYVLLLNDDVIVQPNFLSCMVERGADITGCPIFYYDSSDYQFLNGEINKLFGTPFHGGKRLDYITGCCMLIKREVFEKIGLLDENYFCSFEDADFCLRATKAGFKLARVCGTYIDHKESQTTGKRTEFMIYHHARSHVIFQRKWRYPLFWLYFIPKTIQRVLGGLLLKNPKISWAALKGAWDGLNFKLS